MLECNDVLTIEAMDICLPEAALLIERLTAELSHRCSDDGMGDFHPDHVRGPRSGFLVARWQEQPIACGAFRPMDSGVAEIKRMYVEPAYRGRGIGRRILQALEERARQAGYVKIKLETGTAQPEAVGLYESAGYQRIPPYGFYRDDPRSICFEKVLETPEPQ